jgi:hypothetical protein
MSYTPGPWIVCEQRHPYKDGSKYHVERGIYTQRIHPQLKDHAPIVCLSIGIGMEGEKAVSFVHIEEANARLIAAAPELLEVLKNVTAHLVAAHSLLQRGGKSAAASDAVFNLMLSDYEKSFESGRAAIAKAEEVK